MVATVWSKSAAFDYREVLLRTHDTCTVRAVSFAEINLSHASCVLHCILLLLLTINSKKPIIQSIDNLLNKVFLDLCDILSLPRSDTGVDPSIHSNVV